MLAEVVIPEGIAAAAVTVVGAGGLSFLAYVARQLVRHGELMARIEARLDEHDRRHTEHDERMDRHEDRVVSLAEGHPPDRT